MKSQQLSLVFNLSREDSLTTFAKALAAAAPLADELIIYNLEANLDNLQQLTKSYQANIINLPQPSIVEMIRDRQVRQTKFEWVLILDADEILSPHLQKEIRQLLQSDIPNQVGAYALPRQNYSLGYRIRHGGWDDDYQVRLIRKSHFLNWPSIIHVVPKIEGEIVQLHNPLYHYKDPSLEFIVDKTNRYSDAEAQLFFDGGLPFVTSLTLIRKFSFEIIRRGFLKLGLLDGAIGLIHSIYQGFSVFITYAKLYEKQIND